jgi:hypothetical protein
MKRTLYVNDGRVVCPRRGDIDVEICAVCPSLLDVRHQGDESYITCRPVTRPMSTTAYGPF